MKRLLAILFAAVLALSLPITALAAGTQTGALTINGTVDGKKYDLYKVFDLTWSEGAPGEDGGQYSYTINEHFEDFFEANSIDDPIDYLEHLTANSAALSELAQELLAYAIATSGVNPVKTVEGADGSTQVSGLEFGYYLLNPLGGSVPKDGFATMFALNTLSGEDTEITVKAEYPSIDKVIDDETEPGAKTTNASIGDDIAFKLTTKVPDMTGYTEYYFQVDDTLSKGLTFKENSVGITIDGVALEAGTDYTVTADVDDDTGVTTLSIEFENFLQYLSQTGKDVIITYTATLNEDALIGSANPNKVILEYSNDPKNSTLHGKTVESTTETFTTSLTIQKVDQDKNALTGAAFRIEGDGVNTVLVTGDVFTEDEAGTYYKLKGGSYTETAPNTTTAGLYDDTTTKYKKEENKTTVITSATSVDVEGMVNESGLLTFAGLGAGTYEITEIVTPPGYNTIAPITVTIGFNAGTKEFTVTAGPATVGGGNILNMTVENQTGAVLPETGGIGTTIFYVVGSLLMVVAAVLLVTKKRMSGGK